LASKAAAGFPAYRGIARNLAERIESGVLPSGSRVPSERELASEYGVSLMTARAAVNLLGQRGLVERRARRGTFVARRKIELNLSAVAGLSVRLLREGITPGAEVIEARTVAADELASVASNALGMVRDDEPIHVVVRRRTGNGEPLALEESYFPSRYCPDLLERDLTGSIYELLRDGYGLEPTRLRQEVEPTQLDISAAARFGIRPDVPVLQVTRTAWDAEERTIEFARDLFRGDRLLFVSDTGRTDENQQERSEA
jgi:GntR family transcriptional regulator